MVSHITSIFSRELALSYILIVVAFALSCAGILILPTQIPLWYSLAIPEQQLAPKVFIFVFPCAMATITFLHMSIMVKLATMDTAIVRMFVAGTTLVNFLFLIGLVHILMLFTL